MTGIQFAAAEPLTTYVNAAEPTSWTVHIEQNAPAIYPMLLYGIFFGGIDRARNEGTIAATFEIRPFRSQRAKRGSGNLECRLSQMELAGALAKAHCNQDNSNRPAQTEAVPTQRVDQRERCAKKRAVLRKHKVLERDDGPTTTLPVRAIDADGYRSGAQK